MDRDTTSIVVSVAVLLGILVSRVLLRSRAGISRELDATLHAAMGLEKTDPAGAQQLLDSHFMRQAAVNEQRRLLLRQRAMHDLEAAIELREQLQEDLKTNGFARKEILKNVPEPNRAAIMGQIDASDRDLTAELARLASTIDTLKQR